MSEAQARVGLVGSCRPPRPSTRATAMVKSGIFPMKLPSRPGFVHVAAIFLFLRFRPRRRRQRGLLRYWDLIRLKGPVLPLSPSPPAHPGPRQYARGGGVWLPGEMRGWGGHARINRRSAGHRRGAAGPAGKGDLAGVPTGVFKFQPHA
jgi:hypothetical protein